MDRRLENAWWTLRIGLGAIATVAGLDKFFNLLTYWPSYISPFFVRTLPFSPQMFMYVAGAIEMAVGLAILARWSRYASYLMMGWLLCIAVNLFTARMFDIATRDVAIALAAFALAKLSEVHDQLPLHTERTVPSRLAALSR